MKNFSMLVLVAVSAILSLSVAFAEVALANSNQIEYESLVSRFKAAREFVDLTDKEKAGLIGAWEGQDCYAKQMYIFQLGVRRDRSNLPILNYEYLYLGPDDELVNLKTTAIAALPVAKDNLNKILFGAMESLPKDAKSSFWNRFLNENLKDLQDEILWVNPGYTIDRRPVQVDGGAYGRATTTQFFNTAKVESSGALIMYMSHTYKFHDETSKTIPKMVMTTYLCKRFLQVSRCEDFSEEVSNGNCR